MNYVGLINTSSEEQQAFFFEIEFGNLPGVPIFFWKKVDVLRGEFEIGEAIEIWGFAGNEN